MKRSLQSCIDESEGDAPTCQDPAVETNIQLFFSRSRKEDNAGVRVEDWKKKLSNFWPQRININGKEYPSVEHAFQAAKALCSNKPELALQFECGGSVGDSPQAAKRAGGKTAFKIQGAELDASKWESIRDHEMIAALVARTKVDKEYVEILRRSKELGIYLLHFERQGKISYWGGAIGAGGIVGENRLGKMLMSLRDNV
jgi:ribA/ribD-fused uncharacterized protein